jgi:hypothetical protein
VLRAQLGAGSAPVRDPLDGAENFVSGLPLFAVKAAVMHRGQIVGSHTDLLCCHRLMPWDHAPG